MLVTNFFLLPQQAREFEACINSIHADGGGDIPEDGLEALAYAIRSPWTTEGEKQRHVIVVWSDAGTHELGFGPGGAPTIPKECLPTCLSSLTGGRHICARTVSVCCCLPPMSRGGAIFPTTGTMWYIILLLPGTAWRSKIIRKF